MLFKVSTYGGAIGAFGNHRDYKYHSLLQEPNYQPSGKIDIVFGEDTFDEIVVRHSHTRENRSLFSFRSSFRYNSNLQIREAKAISDILMNNDGASTASDLDQRIEQDYRRLFGKYNTYLEENDCKPSEARAHIIGELNAALKNCLDLEIDNLGNIEKNQGTLFFKKPDSDRTFEYNVLSAGEKEVIDILLDLYLRKDSYVDSIYIIDEPELHLNTSIQRSLLIEINKMVPSNCQIWIATHSIGFLRAL